MSLNYSEIRLRAQKQMEERQAGKTANAVTATESVADKNPEPVSVSMPVQEDVKPEVMSIPDETVSEPIHKQPEVVYVAPEPVKPSLPEAVADTKPVEKVPVENPEPAAESKESVDVSVPAPVPRKRRMAEKKVVLEPRIQSDYAQIRDFPKSMLSVAKAMFPDARTNTDALAAYVYVMNHMKGDVPDTVKTLAATWDGDKTMVELDARIENLEKSVSSLTSLLQELELGVGFMLFDMLGFRQGNPNMPKQADFMERGVEDIITQLKAQTKRFRSQEMYRTNRRLR